MSNSTISAMMMMVGDMSSLNSLPSFNNHHIDDLGLDDDTFHSSVFEIYIPEQYDSQLWNNYEYLNKNANKFIDCTSRNYLIQGELLRFFIIARPPAVVKARALSQSQAERPMNLSQNLKPIAEVPNIITTDTDTPVVSPTLKSPNGQEPLSILPPLPSSSQNLSFEIHMKYSPPDAKYSTTLDQNSVNITEYNPKHSYVDTELKNDYISSSKSSTSYLRANNNNNNNNINQQQQQQLNDKRFIGGIIDVSTPFDTYIPNRDTVNQKPNYFRLSNGDIVFPIEIPIFNRSKNYKQLLSTGNKLDRLLMNETLAVTPSSKVRPLRNFFKQFTLVQPLKLSILPNIVPLDNSHLVSVVVENTHPSLTVKLSDVNIYLFHVLSMESFLNVDNPNQNNPPVPVHRQIGQLVKAANHYIGRPIDFTGDNDDDEHSSSNTVELSAGSQHTFVLKVSPLSLQQQLIPLDGFYTKIKLAWSITTTSGHILSLYDLKVPPPSTSEIMVDLESPSPVRISQRFQVAIKITNLGAKSKQLTITIPAPQRITRATPPPQFAPPPPPKLSGISVQQQQQTTQPQQQQQSPPTTQQQQNGKKTTTTTSSTTSAISSSQSLSKQSSINDLKQSSISSSTTKITPSIGMSKYIPIGSHIQFNEMTTKSLASFDDTQRNSANLICLEKSIYVGDIDSKNSVCIFVDFIAFRTGILTTNDNSNTQVDNKYKVSNSGGNNNNNNNNNNDDDTSTFSLSGFDDEEQKHSAVTLKRKNEFDSSSSPYGTGILKKQNNNGDNNTKTTTMNDSSFNLDFDDDFNGGGSGGGPVDVDLDAQRQELLDQEYGFNNKKTTTTTTTTTGGGGIPEFIWQWKTDNGSYVDYDLEMCKKIEDHRKKTSTDFKVDKERYIDFGRMIQRRYDAPQKCREIKKVPYSQSNYAAKQNKKPTTPTTTTSNTSSSKPTTSSNSTSSTFGFKSTNSSSSNNNNSNNTTSNTTSSPKMTSSSSSSTPPSTANTLSTGNTSRPTTPSTSAVWSWKSDSGWAIYDEATMKQIEDSYVQGKKRFQVDDDRYIDFEYNAQRRYDDPSKMRPVRREDKLANNNSSSSGSSGTSTPPPSVKPIKIATTPTTPTKATGTSSSSSNSNSNASSNYNTSSNFNSSNSNSGNSGNSLYFKKTNNSTSSSSSSSSSSSKTRDVDSVQAKGMGKWKWSADDGQWHDYTADINELIESAYVNAPPVNEQIVTIRGEKKIIDFIAFVQRRFDDRDKRRPIKRVVDASAGPAPSKPKTTSAPQTNFPKYNNNEESDFFDLTDSNYDDNENVDIDDPDFLKKKRKLYACGDQYVVLNDIQTWYQFIEEKRAKFKKFSTTAFPANAKMNKKISLYGGDITALEIDAIVNAARSSLLGGGGIDGAIHKAAGYGLLNECKTLGGCRVGQSKITKGYKLPAKYVIHTVGPMDENADALLSCYTTTLDLITQHKIRSVAMCCVATGVYGFPNDKAAQIAIRSVREWLEIHGDSIDRIIFCVFTKEDYTIYGKLLQSFFPVHPENE
ncbi:hypothetical protein PPL_06071 [Heterostelium album PN500]|uniref:Uncharacterized protein n=1 Tax=Heterostelium pallidum (strain ATCC 26659 / Pp 5 / PN500) TaxID=670386 RepID=D3BC49_HETP5|nr:hypothetical protein PPL_06071 [Heterostelium album PN500]EFA81232.1 hypothetical protein PPL_06071 [Heterostelium album PN500]|eukprot:XP_020433350.1 hypothetical protein PPL_06071 [Heterostelium album PN500]